jgi:hypothetical protein
LGNDAIWRCREGLVFHLLDDSGDGFKLSIDIRDMNTYMQGPREVLIFVSGPKGNILANMVVPDDGIVKGDFKHKDGMGDFWQDVRYREFYRFNSPNGMPPGKTRSPLLDNPSSIPKRTVEVTIPPAGKGLYRLVFVASMDHFISVTPSRGLTAAIHPGPGPLYIPKNMLDTSFLYIPPQTNDVAIMINEEVTPFTYAATINDDSGKVLADIKPKGRFNYAMIKDAEPGSIYEIDLKHGNEPGGYLHILGAPMLLCPDRATAQRLRGGLIEADRNGHYIYHGFQKVLADWAYSLNPSDLSVDTQGDQDLAAILAAQDVNPNSKKYGWFPTINKVFPRRFGFWKQPADHLAKIVANPDSPLYGNRAIIKRIALNRIMEYLLTQNPYFWYGTSQQQGKKIPDTIDSIWDIGLRSNWYPLQDAVHAKTYGYIKELAPYALPADVVNAWKNSFRSWVICRTTMQQGECSNQWGKGLEHMNTMYKATRDYTTGEILKRQIERITTPGILGRTSPDILPYTRKSKVGIDGLACDTGRMGGGVAADGMGHDGEYCLETTSHLNNVWEEFRDPRIQEFLNEYYVLKSHLSVPRGPEAPASTFTGTMHPTDTNFRTRYYTHKSPLGEELRPKIDYGPIWAGKQGKKGWPCLEEGSFVRNVDNRFYFVKTPSYYAIVYGGPALHDYANWATIEIHDGYFDVTGYGGMYYGGYGRKATKIGTISGLWVTGCGATLFGQNHNVNYSNSLWGRVAKPVSKTWEEGFVDPYVVSSSYAQAEFDFDETKRSFKKVQVMDYAPLKLTTEVAFHDHDIAVRLEIEALKDVDFKELYFTLPYYCEDRRVFLYDNGAKKAFEIPKYLTADSRKLYEDTRYAGENPDLPRVTFEAFSVLAENSDQGTKIVLDKPYIAVQTQPLKYRSAAAAIAGFNLVLPTQWQKGKTYTLTYKIQNGEMK